MRKCVIYSRFSPRPNVTECKSIERQLATCEKRARGNYRVIGRYEDRAKSGASIKDRPGLKHAVNQCAEQDAALLVYSADRLARNMADFLKIIGFMLKRNCPVHILNPSEMVVDSKIAGLMVVMFGIFADFERQMIVGRLKESAKNRLAEGWLSGKDAPFGYKPDQDNPKKFVPDELEQKGIEYLIMLHAVHGCGPVKARDELNKSPYNGRGKNGNWHKDTCRKLLVKHCNYKVKPRKIEFEDFKG